MQIRFQTLIIILFLVFSVPLISNNANTMNINSEGSNENQQYLIETDVPSATGFSLTWTSAWNSEPQNVINQSVIVGDKITLNATFNEAIVSQNITRTELLVVDGFTYYTTRPLIPRFYSDWTIDPMHLDDLDWIQISGIKKGDLVNITAYAENDCDYYAFDGDTPLSEYYYWNNLLDWQMVTGHNPENGEFIWESESDTMNFGCFNYDNVTGGNWSVYIVIGDIRITVNSGCSAIVDTYSLFGRNITCEITAIGYTDTNQTIQFQFRNVTLCNYFCPDLAINPPTELPEDSRTLNISWVCSDQNSGDINFFDIWVSNDDGTSYMLLDRNLTSTWYLWNSSGWVEDTYLVKVRAYSQYEAITYLNGLDDLPSDYWPGDFSEAITEHTAGDLAYYYPPPAFNIFAASSLSYEFGSTGNILNVTILFQNRFDMVMYTVTDNTDQMVTGTFQPTRLEDFLVINIDGLSIGSHFIYVEVYNAGVYDGVMIEVDVLPNSITTTTTTSTSSTSPSTNTTTASSSNNILSAMLGTSIGASSVVLILIVMTLISKKRAGSESTDSV